MRRAGRDRSAETDLRKDALQRCGALLASRDYSEAKLREKLRGDEYPEDVIDGVIGELKEAHYVDDARIAGQYVRLHLADRSVERIKQDLYRMGIDREIAEDALREAAEEIDPQAAQEEQIRALLAKRRYPGEAADPAEKQKTMAFLYRKGYPIDLIRHVLDTYLLSD